MKKEDNTIYYVTAVAFIFFSICFYNWLKIGVAA